MPFDISRFGGRVKLSGKVKEWMTRLEQWHVEDFPGKDGRPPFELYISYIISYTTDMVKHQWRRAGRLDDARELSLILSVWDRVEPGIKRLARYDAANYMAEHMSWNDAEPTLIKGRVFANEELRS